MTLHREMDVVTHLLTHMPRACSTDCCTATPHTPNSSAKMKQKWAHSPILVMQWQHFSFSLNLLWIHFLLLFINIIIFLDLDKVMFIFCVFAKKDKRPWSSCLCHTQSTEPSLRLRNLKMEFIRIIFHTAWVFVHEANSLHNKNFQSMYM